MKTLSLQRMMMLLAAFVLASAPMALAASPLDTAKSAGLLGERWDGYLGVVKSDTAATALAKEINSKRRAHYAKIASGEGTSVEAVAAIAGEKLVEGAPSGHYVRTSADADWTRVP